MRERRREAAAVAKSGSGEDVPSEAGALVMTVCGFIYISQWRRGLLFRCTFKGKFERTKHEKTKRFSAGVPQNA